MCITLETAGSEQAHGQRASAAMLCSLDDGKYNTSAHAVSESARALDRSGALMHVVLHLHNSLRDGSSCIGANERALCSNSIETKQSLNMKLASAVTGGFICSYDNIVTLYIV